MQGHASEKPVKIREIQIHHAIAEKHQDKIEYTERRGAGSAPRSRAAQPQIAGIHGQNKDRDDLLGIAIPVMAPDSIDPQQTEDDAHQKRSETYDYAAAAHSLERFQRRETPDDAAQVPIPQQSVLHQIDGAEHK